MKRGRERFIFFRLQRRPFRESAREIVYRERGNFERATERLNQERGSFRFERVSSERVCVLRVGVGERE